MRECAIALPRFHPKQQLAFDSPATDLLFGGATRGGKSFFVRKSYILWCSQIPGLQCDIFRLHFDDVIGENMEGETSFPNLLNAWQKEGLVKINQTEIRFWNDSAIYLEHCADDSVMSKHQGIARHVRTFSEATQILSHRIEWLSRWVTMSEEMQSRVPEKWKGRFPKIIHVTNPIGVSANYYKRNYVQAANPYTLRGVGPWKRQYIPALVEDNPSENAEVTRQRFGTGDAAVADAMLNANWNALIGEFFPEWDEARHVVTDFYPPSHWFRFRGFDWGTAEPFCVLWAAISDGEPFKDSDGQTRWFPRGAIVIYNEWYGCDLQDPSKGNRMRNEDIAAGILARSEHAHKNVVTLTDSLPFQDRGGDTIAQVFQRAGVILTLGDTSRVTGWSRMRDLLIGKELDSNAPRVPMIYFCACCKACRDYIPALPRHPSETKKQDAAEHGEATHAPDTVRLMCMAHTHAVIKDRIEPIDSRVEKELNSHKPTIKKILGDNGGPRIWQ